MKKDEKKVKIKFLKFNNPFKIGDIVELSEVDAYNFITKGIATLTSEPILDKKIEIVENVETKIIKKKKYRYND